ncbi:hypothetical protein JCM11251_005809 [Rhodosporidiobolus azoricus]
MSSLEHYDRPHLSLDLHHQPSRTDSPTPLSPSDPTHLAHHHSHLAPSPIPQDFGSPAPGLPDPETGSFVDRGSEAGGEADRVGEGAQEEEEDELTEEDHRRAAAFSSAGRIFQQLETIKSLQASIAEAHAKLEGVQPLEPSSTMGGAGEDGGREKERDKGARAYEKTQEEFERREMGVEGVMSKLSSLSSALKTFHSLPSPVLFPSSKSAGEGHPGSPATASPLPRYRRAIIPYADVPLKSDSVPVPGEGDEERTRQPPQGRGYSVRV